MNLNDVSNTELFRMYVEQGSKEAISVFFQNQTDLFYRVALKYTRNTADAEDVIQSSFITIIDKASQYNGIKSDEEKLLRSWCLSIVVQCALMKMRSESSRRNREYKYSADSQKPFDEEKNMENQIENKVVHDKIQSAIFQLPEKYRIPIHLKYIEGLELDDIASILKLNANTLRSLIKRGLEKVSLQLKEEKVTLSSIGLIGMIESLPIEQAPSGTKALAAKIFEIPHTTKLMATHTKSSVLQMSLKFVVSFVAISATLALAIYIYKSKESNIELPKSEKNVGILETETNEKWEFINEKDRNLPLLYGEWAWNENVKAMVTRVNSFILLELPIKPQSKPFMVEYVMAPYISNISPETQLFFTNGWVREKIIIENEYIKDNANQKTEYLKFQTIKTYYFKNETYLFVNGVCVAINRFSEDLSNARVSLLTRNYIFQKITSHTFDSAPDELLKARQDNSLKKGELRKAIVVGPQTFENSELAPAKD